MNKLSYNAAAVPVRDDFAAAHSRFWMKLPAAGTWWTGAERVAIAAEVRNAPDCDLCTRRKEALSPTAAEGQHQSLGALSESASTPRSGLMKRLLGKIMRATLPFMMKCMGKRGSEP